MKILLAFLLSIALFLIAFQSTLFDWPLQSSLIEKHSGRENRTQEHWEMLNFLKGDDTTLPLTQEEYSHMEDVRVLMHIFNWVLITFLLTLVLLLYYFKKDLPEVFSMLWIPIVVVLIIGITSFLIPHILFKWFHILFFPQGNYTFPSSSFLITLYPASYFYAVLYHAITRALILNVGLCALGIAVRKNN